MKPSGWCAGVSAAAQPRERAA